MHDIGFGVLGYNRPHILLNTITSLVSQSPDNIVIFLDKPSNPKHMEGYDRCVNIANAFRYSTFANTNVRLVTYEKPQGVEAGVCNSVQYMIDNFDCFVFLEDDCFPNKYAVETFHADLVRSEACPKVYSVYGHHFKIPQEKLGQATIQRFQGWGWGAWSKRIDPVFAEVKKLIFGSREEYERVVYAMLTPEVNRRLGVTRHRRTVDTLRKFQAWDETTAVLTAYMDMYHMPTSRRVIYNCGEDGVHFPSALRYGDFNMIGASEVWSYYER